MNPNAHEWVFYGTSDEDTIKWQCMKCKTIYDSFKYSMRPPSKYKQFPIPVDQNDGRFRWKTVMALCPDIVVYEITDS